jgi:ABC-type branched-subunit amino acid transport system substrate-binding protein
MRRFGLVLLTFGVAVAATSSVTASNAQQTKKSVVVVGQIAPAGGPLVNVPEVQAAMKAWVRAVNKRGGLNGHPVRYDYCNDKNDVNLGLICARKMVDDHAVAVQTGSLLGESGIVPVLAAAGIPMLDGQPQGASAYSSPNVYLLDAGGVTIESTAIGVAVHKFGKRSVIYAVDVPPGHANQPVFADMINQSGGTVTSTVYIPPTTADFGPAMQAGARGNPQVAAILLAEPAQIAAVRTAEQQNLGLKAYTVNALSPTDLTQIGRGVSKVVMASAYKPVGLLVAGHNKLGIRYSRDMRAEVRSGDKDARLTTAGSSALQTYMFGYALEQLTKHMNTITAANVKRALDRAKNINMGGVMAPWTPSANAGLAGKPRVSNLRAWIFGFNAKAVPHLLVKVPLTPSQAAHGRY